MPSPPRSPWVLAFTAAVGLLLLWCLPPVNQFMHEHQQFFYVIITIGAIPTAMFVFIMQSK
jgi:hypothetical protein